MKKCFFPFTLTSTVFAVAMAFADGAENAYVSVEAPNAKATSGVDFAVDGKSESVNVGVTAQPGWNLTTPSVQNISKGQAGNWKATSIFGESEADGEICIPTETITTNHISAPHFSIALNYTTVSVNRNNGNNGNVGVGQGNEHVGEGNNGNCKGIPGVGQNKKDGKGVKLTFAAVANDCRGGRHKEVIVRESCPGSKSNKITRDSGNVTTIPDIYEWEWSCGAYSGGGKRQIRFGRSAGS